MTTVSHGKPYAGNSHVRFEEGDSALAEPRRKSLLHKIQIVADHGSSHSAWTKAPADVAKIAEGLGFARVAAGRFRLGNFSFVRRVLRKLRLEHLFGWIADLRIFPVLRKRAWFCRVYRFLRHTGEYTS